MCECLLAFETHAEGDGMRIPAPVRLIQLDPMPFLFSLSDQLRQTDTLALMSDVAALPSPVQERNEPVDIRTLLQRTPVEPVRLVVETVRVVVPELRPTHLVPHENHWRTNRQQRHRKEVLHLPVAQPFDRGIVRRPLDSAVPASI